MTTTFEAYTPTLDIPSYRDVLELSNRRLKEFLLGIGIEKEMRIIMEIRKCRTNQSKNFNFNDKARWAVDEYSWFMVSNQQGGCDAYCCLVEQDNYDYWEYEFKSNNRATNMKSKIRDCLETGLYWYFRRSAGQPSIINLSYGLIASAFAELTNGIIFTDDNAWDYNMFPTEAGIFLAKYFNPEYPSAEHGSWARECINSLVKNLKY